MITQVDDSLVLDCYRLASYYKLDPRIFLDMPISEVRLHAQRTIELEMSKRPPPGD